MAVEQLVFDILKSLAPCRLLSLSCPDLLLTERFDLPEAGNAQSIRLMHGFDGPIYKTDEVFKKTGIEATYVDIEKRRGVEAEFDLNIDYDIFDGPQWTHEVFDIVLDPGTLEHCFNIAQAFKNARNLCRPGGKIIHINPISAFNHGFWNINPTTYQSFYDDHGDKIEGSTFCGPINNRSLNTLDGHWHERFRVNTQFPDVYNLITVTRSDKPTMEGYPTQWRYRPERKKEIQEMMRRAIEGIVA